MNNRYYRLYPRSGYFRYKTINGGMITVKVINGKINKKRNRGMKLLI